MDHPCKVGTGRYLSRKDNQSRGSILDVPSLRPPDLARPARSRGMFLPWTPSSLACFYTKSFTPSSSSARTGTCGLDAGKEFVFFSLLGEARTRLGLPVQGLTCLDTKCWQPRKITISPIPCLNMGENRNHAVSYPRMSLSFLFFFCHDGSMLPLCPSNLRDSCQHHALGPICSTCQGKNFYLD